MTTQARHIRHGWLWRLLHRWQGPTAVRAEHIGATAEDGIGVIPRERTIAEIQTDGMSDDELREARLAAWLERDYDAELRADVLADLEALSPVMDSYRVALNDAYDRHSCIIGGWASPADRDAERIIANCGNDLHRLAALLNDQTGEWPTTWRQQLNEMLGDKAGAR